MKDEYKSSKTLLAFSLALVVLDLQPSFLSTAEFVKSIQNALKLRKSVLQQGTISFPDPEVELYPTFPAANSSPTIEITSLLPQLNQFLSLASSLPTSSSNPSLHETIRSTLLYLLHEFSISLEIFFDATSRLRKSEKVEKEIEIVLVKDGLTRLVAEIGMDDLLGEELEVQILSVLERIWEREESEV